MAKPHVVEVIDYGDQLQLLCDEGEALGKQLGLERLEPESKQCILLAVVAAVLWQRDGKPPDMDTVQAQALEARRELLEQALEAASALGEAPALVTPAEGNLRVFAHDALHAHHDKDVRTLSTFPLSILRGVTLDVWLVDYWGQLKLVRMVEAEAPTSAFRVYTWAIMAWIPP